MHMVAMADGHRANHPCVAIDDVNDSNASARYFLKPSSSRWNGSPHSGLFILARTAALMERFRSGSKDRRIIATYGGIS